MPDLVSVTYAQTGQSTATDELGMREMQAKAFSQRDSQYLLIKAPPASGKSRAMMFIGLDKLFNQGRKKVIVAVPERAIGSSFAPTELTASGFFADWDVPEANNLCSPGSAASKVAAFQRFLEGPDPILICTHATLRFAHDVIDHSQLNGTVLAIDEFHHVSASEDSRLGELLDEVHEPPFPGLIDARLWKLPNPDGPEPLVCVECRNSTPEPDGTYKTYAIWVAPECQTAHEALAWTFDVPVDDYAPVVES